VGWDGAQLIDKGTFVVDESEHSGAPDIITIRARAADLGGEIRKRTEQSWHDTSRGAILATLAKRNKLTHKVGAKLGATRFSTSTRPMNQTCTSSPGWRANMTPWPR
jgi:phage protein D